MGSQVKSVDGELNPPDEECSRVQSQGKDKSSLETRAQKTGLRQKGEGFPSLGTGSSKAGLRAAVPHSRQGLKDGFSTWNQGRGWASVYPAPISVGASLGDPGASPKGLFECPGSDSALQTDRVPTPPGPSWEWTTSVPKALSVTTFQGERCILENLERDRGGMVLSAAPPHKRILLLVATQAVPPGLCFY